MVLNDFGQGIDQHEEKSFLFLTQAELIHTVGIGPVPWSIAIVHATRRVHEYLT